MSIRVNVKKYSVIHGFVVRFACKYLKFDKRINLFFLKWKGVFLGR